MNELNISLTKPQADFWLMQQEYLYCLFKGGFGAGKSHALAHFAFFDALDSPDALIGVYAPTIALVRDIAMKYILRLLDDNGFVREKDYFVNKNEMKINSNHPQIGSFIFKSMDDPDSIIGYETYTSHVDELDTMPVDKADRAWNMILARTRQWPKGVSQDKMGWNKSRERYEPRNKVCAYTTPEGFRFTYKTWSKTNNKEYKYLEACSYDNPFLPESYIENLKAKYSGPLIEAYLEGKWVNLESGNVYYAYNRNAHSSNEQIRPGEALFIGMDFNVGQMAATVFVKRKGGEEWHAVAEIRDVLDTPDMIEIIKERWHSKGHPITVYPDATGTSRDTANASISDISLLREARFFIRAKKKNPLVKDRVAAVNRAFTDLKIFVNADTCPQTAEGLEQQSYDKNGKPDKSSGFDHGNDAFGYPIAYELMITKKLYSVPISWI